ncbi:hypothetical protein BDY19DRAFT_481722 [Irpex rosettiformis]|uniref:Uncharacterized protein n=1 Tax=Irpex rosettiformis TaxID=378272 RepID=A0ACB8UDJ1_9APHY|nr:hypothetical protein BDY19DRAFT_481722 [Irpex rosettiformis]
MLANSGQCSTAPKQHIVANMDAIAVLRLSRGPRTSRKHLAHHPQWRRVNNVRSRVAGGSLQSMGVDTKKSPASRTTATGLKCPTVSTYGPGFLGPTRPPLKRSFRIPAEDGASTLVCQLLDGTLRLELVAVQCVYLVFFPRGNAFFLLHS